VNDYLLYIIIIVTCEFLVRDKFKQMDCDCEKLGIDMCKAVER
jgi:hypothetical protein